MLWFSNLVDVDVRTRDHDLDDSLAIGTLAVASDFKCFTCLHEWETVRHQGFYVDLARRNKGDGERVVTGSISEGTSEDELLAKDRKHVNGDITVTYADLFMIDQTPFTAIDSKSTWTKVSPLLAIRIPV